jgi:hypothetical protein
LTQKGTEAERRKKINKQQSADIAIENLNPSSRLHNGGLPLIAVSTSSPSAWFFFFVDAKPAEMVKHCREEGWQREICGEEGKRCREEEEKKGAGQV